MSKTPSLLLASAALAATWLPVLACSATSTEVAEPSVVTQTDAGPTESGDVSAVTLRAEDYDQKCSSNEDCAAVYSGDVCAPCQCPNDSVAKTAAGEYASALAAAKASCSDAGDGRVVDCAPCAAASTSCDRETKRCVYDESGASDGG